MRETRTVPVRRIVREDWSALNAEIRRVAGLAEEPPPPASAEALVRARASRPRLMGYVVVAAAIGLAALLCAFAWRSMPVPGLAGF